MQILSGGEQEVTVDLALLLHVEGPPDLPDQMDQPEIQAAAEKLPEPGHRVDLLRNLQGQIQPHLQIPVYQGQR